MSRQPLAPLVALLTALSMVLPIALPVAQAADSIPPTTETGTTVEIDPQLRALLLEAVNLEQLAFEDQYDAQVWMLSMTTRLEPFIADPDERIALLKLVRQEAALSGLKPELVLAVIEVESRFDRFAVSSVGAQGMMQVMPFWKREIGREDDNLIDTATNLRYGCTILKYYLDKEKGNLHAALARYNGSTVYAAYPQLVFKAYRRHWKGGEL